MPEKIFHIDDLVKITNNVKEWKEEHDWKTNYDYRKILRVDRYVGKIKDNLFLSVEKEMRFGFFSIKGESYRISVYQGNKELIGIDDKDSAINDLYNKIIPKQIEQSEHASLSYLQSLIDTEEK